MEKDELALEHLWKNYCMNKGNDANDHYRNLLIEHYQDLVRHAAKGIHAKLPEKTDLDDLISTGIFGLIDAIESYDPSRGIKFESYSSLRIRGSIIDELRRTDWVPQIINRKIKKFQREYSELKLSLGREPHDEEVIARLDLKPQEYDCLKMEVQKAQINSLDAEIHDSIYEGPLCLKDILEDHKSESAENRTCRKELQEFLFTGLSREERLIVQLYYYEGIYLKEIGQAIGIGESRVSQMHKEIIKRIKIRINKKINPSIKEDLAEIIEEASA